MYIEFTIDDVYKYAVCLTYDGLTGKWHIKAYRVYSSYDMAEVGAKIDVIGNRRYVEGHKLRKWLTIAGTLIWTAAIVGIMKIIFS